ncbi:hydantoinase/oxoprolinase family protein [Yaniella halotolerans]|uniref:hydantoinase/oxoprolinase family protein n=1 Tax=Yaniella halotolerans TaxID=225453 RepID=UPI0003B6C989|nr:hydantoinase/oxoprolinase family protein [Yaniella halotolerans]
MFRVGIDVGGTFTDLFAWDESAGSDQRVRTAKVLTTPDDPSRGVLLALAKADIAPEEMSVLIHGTTIATNALLERRFAEPILITTEGFRDTIEIGRQRRENLYDPYQQKSAPLISRHNRLTIDEKMGADGQTVIPLDVERARELAQIIQERDVNSIAIAFINSYQSGEHERQMRDILLESNPDLNIALSSETSPKVRELGRFMTTAIRTALLPVVGDYMTRLEEELIRKGSTAPLYIVKSNGGMMTSAMAKARPEELLESGPAGGVAAGAYISEVTDNPNIIVSDVGGTSFEASLLEDSQGLVTDEYELEWEMPIITPMLDIRSIGAGGGSIAWIDDGGSLRVGPKSAGASPGPAAYGLGGKQPTVTDANVVLGRISADLGGKFELDVEAARTAISTLATKLNISIEDAAEGITQIASESMASAIRMVSSDRGRDPRDHTYVAFGGAGGLHAYELCRSAGIPRIIVPPYAGVACAFGAITMDVRHDLEATFYSPLSDVSLDKLNEEFEKLEAEGRRLMSEENVSGDKIVMERSAAMRYIGQSYEVTTPISSGTISAEDLSKIEETFWSEHQKEYGVHSTTIPAALVNLRVTVIGATEKPSEQEITSVFGSAQIQAPSNGRTRQVYFNGEFHDVPIVNSAGMNHGEAFECPVILEQKDGVVVVPHGGSGSIDQFGNITIDLEKAL